METIRAKFQCYVVEQYAGKEIVRLRPVIGGSGTQNKTWSEYTPDGDMCLHITAEGAIGQFKAGKEYLLEFTPAD